VLLVLVELIGGIGGGSQRWLNLGFMTLQPSELMKPGIVLVLSWFYSVLPTVKPAHGARLRRRSACSASRRPS
jgi:cell division protein FtsW (lipid II flippase)